MPFKTRSKKIAAKNRVVFTGSGSVVYKGISHDDSTSYTKVAHKHEDAGDRLTSATDYKKLQGELTRIILLALLIIGLQLALKFSNIPLLK